MKTLLSFIVGIILLLPAAGFAQQKTDNQLIDELRSKWINYLQNKQLEKATDLYTDDAVFFSPDGNNATGKAEIKKLYQQVMKQFTSHINLISGGVQLSGDIAFDSGKYDEMLTDNNTHNTLSIKGSYLMALKKLPGGSWKISRIMWTAGK